jgi:hypothetical protein
MKRTIQKLRGFPAWFKKHRESIVYGGIILTVVILVGLLGSLVWRECRGETIITPEAPDTTAIDRKAEADKAKAKQVAESEIKKIEAQHAEDIKQFSDTQEREYETVRKKGPKAVAGWLTDFNRELGDK